MSNNRNDTTAVVLATTAKAIANTAAAKKLAEAVGGLIELPQSVVDYIAGPDRVRAIGKARAENALDMANARAEEERLRAETADFVRDRETRKTLNRRSIVAEAQKALPPPTEPVSPQQVSADFIHDFFEEFDGISDPEVHKFVGRLLANEVVKPGSYPRRTLRVLRDLDSTDFASFASLCRFVWNVGLPVPIVFDLKHEIYSQNGLSLESLSELESLGLITYETLAGFNRSNMPEIAFIAYQDQLVEIRMKEGATELQIGSVILTDTGRRLAPLTNPKPIPGLIEYIVGQWSNRGHAVRIVTAANINGN